MIVYPSSTPDGTQTRVLEAGNPTGPAIIFVHGLAARAERWHWNLEPVGGAGYRTLAFDLPGHGLAGRGTSVPATVEGILTTVESIIDRLVSDDSERVLRLVGSSIGGLLCTLIARRRPDRVASLHLSAPLGLEPLGASGRQALAGRLRQQTEVSVRKKIEALGLPSEHEIERWSREELLANGSPEGLAYLHRMADDLQERIDEHLIVDDLRYLSSRVPTFLYWGERDAVVDTDIGRRAHKSLGVPLRTFANSGHAPYLSEPDRFNDCLLEDLQRSSPQRA